MHSSVSCRVIWNEKEQVLVFPASPLKVDPCVAQGVQTQQVVSHGVVAHGVYARGLTKSLIAQFSPNFSISVAMKDLPKKTKKHGRFYGNQADKYVVRWIEKGLCPKDNDPRFLMIREAVMLKKWLAVAAQVPVGCRHLRLATKIDMICQTLQKRIILVEVKCGFDDYFDIHNQGKLAYPWSYMSMSFRNKAFLQLLFTTFLFFHAENDWKQYDFGGAYILHIFEKDGSLQYKWYPLPYWTFCCLETLQQSIQCLKTSKNLNKRQRTQAIQNGAKRARYAYQKNNNNITTQV